jgi:hypothetical protein
MRSEDACKEEEAYNLIEAFYPKPTYTVRRADTNFNGNAPN